MKKSSFSAATLLFLTWSPAFAQETPTSIDGTGRLAFAGEATRACVIGQPEATGGFNATLRGTAGGNSSIEIGRLVDPVNATPLASSINLGFQVICNHAHVVSVRSGSRGLRLQQTIAASGGFETSVDYALSLSWSGQNRQINASAGDVQINASDGAAGVLSLSIETPRGGRPLVAGTYADSVIVELTPTS
jgi:hypothetical protein